MPFNRANHLQYFFIINNKAIYVFQKSLRVLNVTGLRLDDLRQLRCLHGLRQLIAAENSFNNATDLGLQLQCFPALRKVTLHSCPAQKELHYRDMIVAGAFQIGRYA